jgi:hypothetical protein
MTSDEAARQSRRDDELDYLEKGVRLMNMMAGVLWGIFFELAIILLLALALFFAQ